jgi:hypothetical protein
MISASVTVGTTPTLLVAAGLGTRTLYIHVIGNTTVYLGGATVTTATGTATEKHTTPIAIEIRDGQTLYGIVAAATEDVRVLRQS